MGDPWTHLSIVEVTLPAAPKAVCKVEVEAVDLNFADILQCQGSYQVKLDAPFTPGMNAVGKVIEVGKNSGCALGDRFTRPWAGCAFYQLDKLNFHFVQVPWRETEIRLKVTCGQCIIRLQTEQVTTSQ